MPLKHYEHCCSTIQALASLGKIEGVIPLLHGPQPCSYQNQVGSMSCRPAQLVTAGTLVNKSDVIFGGEEGLKQQVKNLYEKYHPRVIVIINTCIPQLIGEDSLQSARTGGEELMLYISHGLELSIASGGMPLKLARRMDCKAHATQRPRQY